MCGQSCHSAGYGIEPPPTEPTLIHSSFGDARHTLRTYTPESTLCDAAANLLVSSVSLPIVHHSVRVYLFASWIMDKENTENVDKELLFIACICHDIGASDLHDGPQRFEVEGADAAAHLMRRHEKSETDIHEVWAAIALHTSPGIAERISVLARLVRLGVLTDFDFSIREMQGAASYGDSIESQWPRLSIEKVLGDTVVEQAVRKPGKAPTASWPGDLYRSHLDNPEWPAVNRAF